MIDVDAFVRQSKGSLRSMIQQYLIAEPQSGFLNPESVRSLLLQEDAGRSYSEILGRLLTVEIWYRQFVQAS